MADGDLSMTVTVTVPAVPTLVTASPQGRAADDRTGSLPRSKGTGAQERRGHDAQEITGRSPRGTIGRVIVGETPPPPEFDTDAEAFFTAAGITDETQKTALDDLVVALKADGLWTKMRVIYPFVGGSASSHAVNLKSPGTYNGTFEGGWTHAANGVTPNGTDGRMDTGFDFLSEGIAGTNSHWSVYSRTNNLSYGAAIGSVIGNAEILLSYATAFYGDWPQYSGVNRISASNSDASGMFSGGTSATRLIAFRNGAVLAQSNATADTPFSAGNTYFGTGYFGQRSDNQQYAFGSLGTDLSDAEHVLLRTAVQTFQTTLGRQV
jgi:hypothetical protein